MTDPPDLIAAKRAIRAEVRRTRAVRSPGDRRRDDATRNRRLLDWFGTRQLGCVAAYLSAGDEPDTRETIEALAAQGIEVLLPVSREGAWTEPGWALWTGSGDLRRGPRDLDEPAGPALPVDAVSRADVVLCPGLAGTAAGDRLGRGGGWYDRVLPLVGGPIVLLLNDDEVLASLPTGPLDRRVDVIITPRRVIECSGRTRDAR